MIDLYHYQVGGSLSNDAPSYVVRQADFEIYNALKKGDFCYVLNSRQMGKSSLLVKTRHRLEREGKICCTIDLTRIGIDNITPNNWYKGIVAELCRGLNLFSRFNLKSWWKEQEDFSPVQKLSHFIEDIILTNITNSNVVIFIDEIDSILNLNFSVDDFFNLIRFFYNQKTLKNDYQRIAFAFFGVASPNDLINNKQKNPFNFGKTINLSGFKLEEALFLGKGLSKKEEHCQKIVAKTLEWTGGQPFLTQKIFYLLQQHLLFEQQRSPNYEINWDELVNALVEQKILDNWEYQDEPEHLKTICNRILFDWQNAGKILSIYQQLLAQEQISANYSKEHKELILSGLVINEEGHLKIANLIYQKIFNPEWVREQLEKLRPYAKELKDWVASEQKDRAHLLRGTNLQTSLFWAQNKKLGDLDYRFLAASQQLAKEEIEQDLEAEKKARRIELEKAKFALQTVKQANYLIQLARQEANYKLRTLKLGKRWIFSISATVSFLTILLRLTGWLQNLEWSMLDRFFQNRSPVGIQNRIAIIAIEDRDIQTIKQYPISDGILAKAIAILKKSKPRAIGLDIYRDLPVQPGEIDLNSIFANTSNLVGINKIVSDAVAPPSILAKLDRVGFADQILDSDGKVRRALLSLELDNQKLALSFALKLSLIYLKAENIEPKILDKYQYQIGKSILVPFEKNDGGYVRADAGGYQVLLNFYGPQSQFKTFSLSNLLAEKIPPRELTDRIILIGYTAESVKDLFQTPYTNKIIGYPEQMSGVIVHANIISQLLHGALEGRPWLKVWSKPIEYLWIWGWAICGAFLSWRFKSSQLIVGIILLATVILLIFCYLAFLMGWWIPIVPAVLSLIGTATILPIIISRQLIDKARVYQTVQFLLNSIAEQPIVVKIALEYLKESETKENQLIIVKLLEKYEDSSNNY